MAEQFNDGMDYDFNPSVPDNDPWSGWRVPSQDHNGHTERVQVRIQPGHLRMAQDAVATKQWPYRDTGDLIRHALHLHLSRLRATSGVPIMSQMSQVEAVNRLLEEEEYLRDYQAMFERLNKMVTSYLSMNAPQEAGVLVRRVRQNLADMPLGPWRVRYLRELDTRYGEYVTLPPPDEGIPQPQLPPYQPTAPVYIPPAGHPDQTPISLTSFGTDT